SRASFPWLYRWLAGRRLRAVQNGMDVARAERIAGSVTPKEGARKTVLSVGRLIEIKNPLMLLRGFARGADEAAELLYVGEGKLRSTLEQEIREQGLHGRVALSGLVAREQVYREFAQADFYVSTSRGEGLPVAVLEAMACGRPVILSDIPPHREIAAGAEFIPLVACDDEQGWAREIAQMRARSPEEKASIGQACREIVRQRFSLEAMHREYPKIYQEVRPRCLQVELIGCTGAGKSTLAKAALQVGATLGERVVLSDDLILRRLRLGWLPSETMRTVVIDLCAFFACLATAPRHWRYYRFAMNICLRSAGGWLTRMNLVRNALRKIGVYEVVRCLGRGNEIVLVDEGTVHAAHNLFVDGSRDFHPDDFQRFLDVATLPDAVVYLSESEHTLVERTMRRGHKRIARADPSQVETFVRQAVGVFEYLRGAPQLAKRMFIVDGTTHHISSPQGNVSGQFGGIERLVRSGISHNTP
ncbi:MAG: glycosyltransferase, partial [Planctomycetales bacterium]|nr:glycosyltransferase [Planctomycetales bacterium]